MTGIFMAGCGIKILRRERDVLIFFYRQKVLELTAGCGIENRKSLVTDVTYKARSG